MVSKGEEVEVSAELACVLDDASCSSGCEGFVKGLGWQLDGSSPSVSVSGSGDDDEDGIDEMLIVEVCGEGGVFEASRRTLS